MTQHCTTSCHKFGQPEISIALDESSKIEPKWLIDFFETSVTRGERFHPNKTVQIGWMLTMVKEGGPQKMEVYEPQFDSIPIKWILGVNNTIRHLVWQRSVADLFAVEPKFPSLRDAGLVSHSFLTADQKSFSMIRETPRGNDSGWSFTSFPDDTKAWEHRSLLELSFHNMLLVPFLALPSGTTVQISNEQIIATLNGVSVTSQNNDFLKELLKVQIWV